MRRSQGRYFSPEEIDRIKSLLTSTDMTLQEIATRMECAKSSIVAINRMFQIREYRGRRNYWVLADSIVTENSLRMETAPAVVSSSWAVKNGCGLKARVHPNQMCHVENRATACRFTTVPIRQTALWNPHTLMRWRLLDKPRPSDKFKHSPICLSPRGLLKASARDVRLHLAFGVDKCL